MQPERPLDRRNRRWGSLRDAVKLRVRLSKRAKEILSALRNCDEEQVGYGAVIEKLVEKHAHLLAGGQATEKTNQALPSGSSPIKREPKIQGRNKKRQRLNTIGEI